ncbi:MAG TPA: hypothetical protein VIT89_10880 [Solirubrobacterales bacterium]
MIGTYVAVVAICAASLTIGQAAICLCGARRWSWLAPAVGLALVCAVCWGTVRLPGDGVLSAIALLVLAVAAVAYLWGRVEGAGEALVAGWPVALGALLATALPFVAEGHFGILGTSFNPDMSQHLLAADRLAEGNSSQLLVQGYPLGPHAVVVALNKGLGVGLVQGFTGLTISVGVLASLTALAAFRELPALPRTAGALLVGLAYLVASYFAQGAFKETMQALYLLAFVLALRESTTAWANLPLRFVPAALIAVGSVYTYSFPGLIWLGGALVIWLLANLVPAAGGDDREDSPGRESPRSETGPAARGLGLALLAFLVFTLPELGRMLDFKQFETFDPNGPGLGNLFGQVSPFEALGIWPSGDFRLSPGDGAVPAIGYYLGVAFALALLAYGLVWLWRRREAAILSGLAAAALAYAAARTVGTPYTAAKAIEVGAPLVALAIVLPVLSSAVGVMADIRPKLPPRLMAAAAGVFVLAAGACSLLALANAPVGPTAYSSKLSEYRKLVGAGPTLVVASPQLLEEEHGVPYLSWELRGGRVCIQAAGEDWKLPVGTRFVIFQDPENAFELSLDPEEGPEWSLKKVLAVPPGKSPCPLIAVRQARQGPAR